MSDAIIIAIIGVAGNLLALWFADHLQQRRTVNDISIQTDDRPSGRPTIVEERTYYDQRIEAVINAAEKTCATDKQREILMAVITLIPAIIVGIIYSHIGMVVITWGYIAILTGIPLWATQIFRRKKIREEIVLSQFDKSALFTLRDRTENNKKINGAMKENIQKTITKELKPG